MSTELKVNKIPDQACILDRRIAMFFAGHPAAHELFLDETCEDLRVKREEGIFLQRKTLENLLVPQPPAMLNEGSRVRKMVELAKLWQEYCGLPLGTRFADDKKHLYVKLEDALAFLLWLDSGGGSRFMIKYKISRAKTFAELDGRPRFLDKKFFPKKVSRTDQKETAIVEPTHEEDGGEPLLSPGNYNEVYEHFLHLTRNPDISRNMTREVFLAALGRKDEYDELKGFDRIAWLYSIASKRFVAHKKNKPWPKTEVPQEMEEISKLEQSISNPVIQGL